MHEAGGSLSQLQKNEVLTREGGHPELKKIEELFPVGNQSAILKGSVSDSNASDITQQ